MSDVMSDCSDDSFEVVSAETCEEPEDVLTSSYKPLVLFQEMFDVYPVDSDIVAQVSFSGEYEKSSEDTVIIMPLAWTSLDQGLCVVKLSGTYVKFDVKDLPKTSADKFYQLCYATEDKTIVGVSIPFSFREVHEDELIEFRKDQTNKDFWTFRSRFAVLMNIYWNSLVENMRTINFEDVDHNSEQSDDSLVDVRKSMTDNEAVTGSKMSENELIEIKAAINEDDTTDSAQQPEIPKRSTEECEIVDGDMSIITRAEVESVLPIDINCAQQGGNLFLVTPSQIDTLSAADSICVQQGGIPFLVAPPKSELLSAIDPEHSKNEAIQEKGPEVKAKVDQLTQAFQKILDVGSDERQVFEECLNILSDAKAKKISLFEANKNIIMKLKSFNDRKFEELLIRKQDDLHKMNGDVNHIEYIHQQEIQTMRKRIMELEKLVFELMPDGWPKVQAVISALLLAPKAPVEFETFLELTYGSTKVSPYEKQKACLAYLLRTRLLRGPLATNDLEDVMKALNKMNELENARLFSIVKGLADSREQNVTPTNGLQEVNEIVNELLRDPLDMIPVEETTSRQLKKENIDKLQDNWSDAVSTEPNQPEEITETFCQMSRQSTCDENSKETTPKMILKSSSLSPAVQQMETPFTLSLQKGMTKLRCEIDLLEKEKENLTKKLRDTHSDLDYFKQLYQVQMEEKNQKEEAYGAKLAKLVFEKEKILEDMKKAEARYEERLKTGSKEYAKLYLKCQKYKNCQQSGHTTYAASGSADS